MRRTSRSPSPPPTLRTVSSRRAARLVVAAMPLWIACAQTPEAPSGPPVDYVSQVQPLLEKYCYACHGDVRAPSGRLRLDSEAAALRGGRAGEPAVFRGNAAASPMLLAMKGRDDFWRLMPPEGNPAPTRE